MVAFTYIIDFPIGRSKRGRVGAKQLVIPAFIGSLSFPLWTSSAMVEFTTRVAELLLTRVGGSARGTFVSIFDGDLSFQAFNRLEQADFLFSE